MWETRHGLGLRENCLESQAPQHRGRGTASRGTASSDTEPGHSTRSFSERLILKAFPKHRSLPVTDKMWLVVHSWDDGHPTTWPDTKADLPHTANPGSSFTPTLGGPTQLSCLWSRPFWLLPAPLRPWPTPGQSPGPSRSRPGPGVPLPPQHTECVQLNPRSPNVPSACPPKHDCLES